MDEHLLQVMEPADYFTGIGTSTLSLPSHILFFLRKNKEKLQQNALHNRSHHRALLCFNLQTEGVVHLDHLELQFKPGQALLILPYQFHHYSQLSSHALKWLFCSFELASKHFLEPLRNQVLTPGEKSQQQLESLLKEWHAPSSSLQSAQLQCALLRLLLCLRQDNQEGRTNPPYASENSLIRSVNGCLEEWRRQSITIADLATAIGYSESRLRVLFKQAAGVPLGAYIHNYRITRAMALLRTTPLSIADVAMDAGFGSPQAFSRIFKSATTFTPRDYRAQAQNK
ncbi:helix-turn-helix transcriptional regulator [Kiritimatiellota bacterium B12222]|nr:helix-turn-helix transcriptional regulator [Kiritimatiellota bacterium B12222]